MSEDSKTRRFSESLVLDDSEKGVIITGITDDTIAAKSGLQAGDEIVAATIHLDHLNKNEVLNILKVLEPYDNNMKVLTKKELSASAGLGSLGLGLKDQAEMLNLKNGLGGKVTGHTLNGDLPSLSLNKLSADADCSSLGLTGPYIKGDLDGTLKAPDVSVSAPQLNAPSTLLDIEKPEIKTGDLKYKTPKFIMPHFNLPQITIPKAEMDVSGDVDLPSVNENLEAPDLNLSAPKLDLKSPDLDLNGPKVDLNGPDVNLETPNADIEAPSGKIKWPHLKWKGPKVRGPDGNLNADLSAPDVNLSTPKIDGDLSAPEVDINIPKADIKGPDLDVQTPNLDIDATSGKINWPHLKWKKPKIHGPKGDLDLDANLNTPDVDISGQNVEGGINAPDADISFPQAVLKGPDLDMQTPNTDVEAPAGKINWPHLKWKKTKGPKADLDIDADLNTPDLNLSTPKIDGDVNVPNAELNLPNAIQTPDLDIDAPSGKINWPHLKWKKPKLHGPKADMDLNADLSTPDVDLSVPKINSGISTPDVDLNLPKADVDVMALDVDTEAPSGKIKFPTLKKPKFLLPRVKSPDVDIDADVEAPDLKLSPKASLDRPDIDLNLPTADVDVKAPNVDIEPPSGKFKWPTLKKPKWTVSGPKVNGPDVGLDADVSAPDFSLSAPKIDGDINAPDVNLNLPKAEQEAPNLDIDTPDVEGPSGKFKWPTFKKPKFGTLKGPKADADMKVPDVDLKAPDVDLSAPDVNLIAPKIEGGIKAPDLNINMPNADVKGPDVDLNGPDLNLESQDGKLKFPKFKLPKLKVPKVKGPELDASLEAPDIDASPNVDLKAPDLSLSAKKIEGCFDTPDLDISLPKADLKGPDVDLQAPEVDASPGKFKLPKIKLPNFGLSESRVKGPNLDVDADLKSSDLDLPAPAIKGNLSTPDLDLNADVKRPSLDLPIADLQVPDLNLKAPDLSLSPPKIDGNLSAANINTKLPKAELEAPDHQVTLKAPNVDINVPKPVLKAPDAQLKTPDLDLDSHLGDFKVPYFKQPKLDLSSPEVEIPSIHPSGEDANISVPAVDLSVPKAAGDIKGPELNVKAPNVDANLEKSKFPHFKLPKLHLPGSNIKGPEVDTSANLEVSPVKVKAPSHEGEISSPHVSVSAPEVKTSLNTPELDITAKADAEVKDSPKSKLRWPFKWGFKSGSDEEGSGPESETEVSGAEVEVPAFKFHRLPRNSIDGIGGIPDTLSLSKLDTEAKDYVVRKGIRLPVVNATSKTGEKIDIIERLKMAKEKAPSANVSPTEAKTDIDLKLAAPSLDISASKEDGDSSLVRGGTFKVEKPESGLGLVTPEILTSDENDKLSLSLSNMLGLNINDSDAD
ncbi:neuroblast differentiation-associated protein AHNAK [Morone saxatilis]|uniref:neuroblast differentiation-associated protein AHNAK n=1 Tax=Morone saxatilis TaxID=34816 RepID=UPI0015E22891|nr:neuroblast differentiation-associated protein AHNAK [Morone saxatilis]